MCSPYHRGGIERWMTDMATEWRRVHGESWFVAPVPRRPFVNGSGRPTVADILAAEPVADRPTLTTPLVGSAFEFGTEAYRASVYARALVAGVPASVAVLVGDDPAAWRAAASLSQRNPFIAVIHGEWAGYDALVRRYERSISAFVGVSNRVTQRVRAVVPNARVPIVTIACGIRSRDNVQRVPGADVPLRLAWVGRMSEEAKRVSDLPKIAAALRERGIPFSLEIMGDGEERALVADSIRQRNLESHVTLLPWGTPAEVQQLLARVDVMLLPSNREGMPITVMEALGLGCGIVATRISGIEDYAEHPAAEGCLWTYPVGDVAAAAAAIDLAANTDPAERVRRAKQLATLEFSAARAVERYTELIAALPKTHYTPGGTSWRERIARALSYPVAAQRIVRVWSTGRFSRPRPVEVPGHSLTA
jgi:glycosyltransferase involved in cell wall biosynthesis